MPIKRMNKCVSINASRARNTLSTIADAFGCVIQSRKGPKNTELIRVLNSSKKVVATGSLKRNENGYDAVDFRTTVRSMSRILGSGSQLNCEHQTADGSIEAFDMFKDFVTANEDTLKSISGTTGNKLTLWDDVPDDDVVYDYYYELVQKALDKLYDKYGVEAYDNGQGVLELTYNDKTVYDKAVMNNYEYDEEDYNNVVEVGDTAAIESDVLLLVLDCNSADEYVKRVFDYYTVLANI